MTDPQAAAGRARLTEVDALLLRDPSWQPTRADYEHVAAALSREQERVKAHQKLALEARRHADFMQRCADGGQRPAQLAMAQVALTLTRCARALSVSSAGRAGTGMSERCGCAVTCGDDGDVDGPGVCKGLPVKREPLVEIVLVHRDDLRAARSPGETQR